MSLKGLPNVYTIHDSQALLLFEGRPSIWMEVPILNGWLQRHSAED